MPFRRFHALPAGLRRALFSGSWLSLEQAVRMAAGLVVGVYVARHLGPHGFGVLAYATGLMFIASALARFGLAEVTTRDLIGRPADAPATLGSALLLRVAGGVAGYGVLLGYAWLSAADTETRVAVVLVGSALLGQPFDAPAAWFMARQQARPVVLARIIGTLVCAGLRLAFVAAGLPLMWLAWPIAAEIVLGAALITLIYWHTQALRPRLRVDGAHVRRLFVTAVPLTLTTATSELNLRLPQVLLVQLRDAVAAGQYAAAMRISEGLHFLPVIACSALFPALVTAQRVGGAVWASRTEALYAAMIWAGIVVAAPISLAAPALIGLLFGPDYAPAAQVLAVHAWSLPLIALAVARQRTLLAESRVRFNLLAAMVNLACNLGLAWLLIPPLGAVGAAWASVLPRLVSGVALNFVFAHARPHGIAMLRGLCMPWLAVRISRHRERV